MVDSGQLALETYRLFLYALMDSLEYLDKLIEFTL